MFAVSAQLTRRQRTDRAGIQSAAQGCAGLHSLSISLQRKRRAQTATHRFTENIQKGLDILAVRSETQGRDVLGIPIAASFHPVSTYRQRVRRRQTKNVLVPRLYAVARPGRKDLSDAKKIRVLWDLAKRQEPFHGRGE